MRALCYFLLALLLAACDGGGPEAEQPAPLPPGTFEADLGGIAVQGTARTTLLGEFGLVTFGIDLRPTPAPGDPPYLRGLAALVFRAPSREAPLPATYRVAFGAAPDLFEFQVVLFDETGIETLAGRGRLTISRSAGGVLEGTFEIDVPQRLEATVTGRFHATPAP